MRLYTLDCGRLDFADMALVSDTADYAGHSGTMAVPCFLVHHDADWLLWDTGLGDEIAASPGGVDRYGFHWTVRHTWHPCSASTRWPPDGERASSSSTTQATSPACRPRPAISIGSRT
jgi:hypothetical protein